MDNIKHTIGTKVISGTIGSVDYEQGYREFQVTNFELREENKRLREAIVKLALDR